MGGDFHAVTNKILYKSSTGLYMRMENRRRNRFQNVNITAQDVETEALALGPKSPSFRYMY